MIKNYPVPRDSLLAFCKETFEGYDLAPNTIDIYMSTMRHIAAYMEFSGIEYYTVEFSDSFLQLAAKEDKTQNRRRTKRYFAVTSILNRALQGLPYIQQRKRRCVILDYPENELGRYGRNFVDSIKEKNLSSITISNYQRIIKRFTSTMADNGRTKPSDLVRSEIIEFAATNTRSDYLWYTILKKFLVYLSEITELPKGLINTLDGKRKQREVPIPSYYTSEEVLKIENAYDRSTKQGKRNYAMILLASRLGLRSSDIRGLKLEDIDWTNNQIRIVQYKTDVPLTLPLLADVGNAIVDYLRYGRPDSRCRNVFLTCIGPFRPIECSSFSAVVSRAITLAGIDSIGRHTGPHSLRHSLATAMMKSGARLQEIADTLGHSSTQSTMPYLSINIDELKECTHVVPPVEESFYTQEGGAFYV